MNDERSAAMPDEFDRILGSLDGLPDVSSVKPTTIRTITPLVGAAQTFIIQTFRQRDVGDTIFIEHVGKNGSLRLVIPPKVADAISRQRDALTARARSRAAKAVAADRKERGEVPGFMRKRSGK